MTFIVLHFEKILLGIALAVLIAGAIALAYAMRDAKTMPPDHDQ